MLNIACSSLQDLLSIADCWHFTIQLPVAQIMLYSFKFVLCYCFELLISNVQVSLVTHWNGHQMGQSWFGWTLSTQGSAASRLRGIAQIYKKVWANQYRSNLPLIKCTQPKSNKMQTRLHPSTQLQQYNQVKFPNFMTAAAEHAYSQAAIVMLQMVMLLMVVMLLETRNERGLLCRACKVWTVYCRYFCYIKTDQLARYSCALARPKGQMIIINRADGWLCNLSPMCCEATLVTLLSERTVCLENSIQSRRTIPDFTIHNLSMNL